MTFCLFGSLLGKEVLKKNLYYVVNDARQTEELNAINAGESVVWVDYR